MSAHGELPTTSLGAIVRETLQRNVSSGSLSVPHFLARRLDSLQQVVPVHRFAKNGFSLIAGAAVETGDVVAHGGDWDLLGLPVVLDRLQDLTTAAIRPG
jgi:hypothetical protein